MADCGHEQIGRFWYALAVATQVRSSRSERAVRVPIGRITQLPRVTWTGSGTASRSGRSLDGAVCTSSTGLLDGVFERSNGT